MNNTVIETYLLQKKLEGVKNSTLANYSYKLEANIMPCFINGTETTEDELYMSLEKYQEIFANKTYNDLIILMNDFLNFLYNKKYMSYQVKLPCPKLIKNKIVVLTEDEQVGIETYLINNLTHFNFSILLALYTGIRIGELSALKHGDICNDMLNITKSLQRVKNLDKNAKTKTKIIIDTPKSEKSIRQIPVPQFLIELYSQLPNKNNNDYVLTNTKKYIEPRSIERKFKIILEKCNIEDNKFHILRHTFATECIKVGFDPKTLSEILGHANVKITLDRYVHSDIMIKKKSMAKLKCKAKSQSVQLCDNIKELPTSNIFIHT